MTRVVSLGALLGGATVPLEEVVVRDCLTVCVRVRVRVRVCVRAHVHDCACMYVNEKGNQKLPYMFYICITQKMIFFATKT